jgi:hypothetical protein
MMRQVAGLTVRAFRPKLTLVFSVSSLVAMDASNNSGLRKLTCLMGGLAVAISAAAITGDPSAIKHGVASAPQAPGQTGTNESAKGTGSEIPYDVIVTRNVFALRDPDPPLDTNQPVVNTPPPNVKLTGIMEIFGKKQALFMVQKNAQPGKPPDQPVSCIMGEGQRQEGLEVLEINRTARKVTVKIDGSVSTLTFDATTPSGPDRFSANLANPALGRMHPQARPGFNPNMMNPGAPTPPAPPLPTNPNLPPGAVNTGFPLQGQNPPEPAAPVAPQETVPAANETLPGQTSVPAQPAQNIPAWLQPRATGTGNVPPLR